jgi:class 3 adenylate cyclase
MAAAVVNAGAGGQAGVGETRCIRFTNICALLYLVFYLLALSFGVYAGVGPGFMAVALLFMLADILVIFLNSRGGYRAGRLALTVTPAVFIVFAGWYFPPDTLIPFLLLSSLVCTFLIHPSGDTLFLPSAVFVGACYLGSMIFTPAFSPVHQLTTTQFEVARYLVVIGGLVSMSNMGWGYVYAVWLAGTEAETERARADRLLLNMLPAKVGVILKDSNARIAERSDEVSIMFADLAGFTAISQAMTPLETAEFLNEVFSALDDIADRHGVEKIKTIGDSYMAAAGIPEPCADHAGAIAGMALEVMRVVGGMKTPGGSSLAMRIGISSGTVVSGVIGRRKFTYDLWGDAVNTASRMESNGVEGRIQVTGEVYERLKDRFVFEYRGKVDVKGKGLIPAWFLTGRKQVQADC